MSTVRRSESRTHRKASPPKAKKTGSTSKAAKASGDRVEARRPRKVELSPDVKVGPTRPYPPPDAGKLLAATPEAFVARIRQDVTIAKAEIEALKAMPPDATKGERKVKAALQTYDTAMGRLVFADSRADLCKEVHPNKAMREAAAEAQQEVRAVLTDLSLDRGLFDVLSRLDLSKQSAPTKYWMKRVLESFKREGVGLDDAKRAKAKELQGELVKLGQKFDGNIRDDRRTITVSPQELEGLPKDFLDSHPAGPDGKVTLSTDRSDYDPVMAYAKNPKTREALWRVYMQRAYPQNLPVLDELLATRHELATLLGYRNWAHYSTEDKMIGNEKAVGEFIAKIAAPAKERAQADYAELLARKQKDDPSATEVFPWESTYLISRIQAERYKADPQAARPYFEFNAVKEGLLELTSRLFGVSYRKVSKPGVWTDGVDTYDVLDAKGERVLGRIYLDLHPRDGKYKHFAQFSVINGKDGERLPEGALVCNFPEPKEGAPALLEHDSVQTFFHEFGHLLHHVLGGHTEWSAISGVANEWDFVEAPSQLLEEWAWDPAVLQTFAKHHETGEPIPTELVKAMKAADEFGKGAVVTRQLSFAALSLSLHDRDPAGLDTTQLMADLKEKYTPFKHVEGDYFHAAFGHLNGYSSNYYTYMWSLVIAKDLAGKFEKSGWLNPEEPRRYRTHVLEPGGSKPAADLVADFLGRPYQFAAFEKWLKA